MRKAIAHFQFADARKNDNDPCHFRFLLNWLLDSLLTRIQLDVDIENGIIVFMFIESKHYCRDGKNTHTQKQKIEIFR